MWAGILLSISASAILTWTPPTQNTDGSPLIDLDHYEIYYGCTAPGSYEFIATVPAPASSHEIVGLPEFGTCYFVATSVTAEGVASVFSNEASKFMGVLPLPGQISNLNITWQESPEVTLSYVGGATNSGSGSFAVITHGLTINPGNLVQVYVNSNDTSAITPNQAFVEEIDEVPAGDTARHGYYWMIAGNEPLTYSFQVGSATWRVVVKVFEAGGNFALDSVPVSHRTTVDSTNVICGAVNGQSVSAGALSTCFASKDWRNSAENYTVADNGFGNVVGNTQDQVAVGTHRILVGAETFSDDVVIETADGSDDLPWKSYSVHASFVIQ